MDPYQANIEFHSRDKHQVEQPQLSELWDRRIAGSDQVQPVWPDHKTAQEQPDNPREARVL